MHKLATFEDGTFIMFEGAPGTRDVYSYIRNVMQNQQALTIKTVNSTEAESFEGIPLQWSERFA